MHQTLKKLLEENKYENFAESLQGLSQEQIDEIMQEDDIISFLLACYLGDENYINNNIDLEKIREHDYFTLQIAAKNGKVEVMKILKDHVKENGDEEEWFEMFRTDDFLAFKEANFRAREWLKDNLPISYKLALEGKDFDAKKRDSKWKLEIHQLDVGQGDSALVLFKKLNEDTREYEVEKSILIDGGRGFNYEYLMQYLYEEFSDNGANYSEVAKALIQAETDLTEKQLRLSALEKKVYADGSQKKEREKLRDEAVVEVKTEIDGFNNAIQNARTILSAAPKLDVVIISHDDADHNEGVLELVKKRNPLVQEQTKFIIQSGKANGNDAVYPALKSFVTQGIAAGAIDQEKRKRIIFAYNNIGKNIWEILGEEKPQGAPAIELVASDGSFKGDESLDLHNAQNRKELASQEEDNNGSIVSIISIGNVRYYSAGDFERNGNLVEYLQLKEKAADVEYFPIQAFLVAHHGSSDHLKRNFVEELQARAAIISHGSGVFNKTMHPTEKTIDDLQASELESVYLTNPKRDAAAGGFVEMPSKFSVAGSSAVNNAEVVDIKNPKGTIKVQTYQSIAGANVEKFMVKYKTAQSKTRDYFKDKDFDELKNEILEMVGEYDEHFRNNLQDHDALQISLSKTDLEKFLDEDGKLKHINRATLKDFFSNYDSEKTASHYLLISFTDNVLSFEIGENKEKEKSTRLCGSKDYAQTVYQKVKDVETKFGDSFGLYFDDNAHVPSFVKGGTNKNLADIVSENRYNDSPQGRFFLKADLHKDDHSIEVTLLERTPLLKKEYHKGIRQEQDSHTHKVMARRVEYGSKADRTPT